MSDNDRDSDEDMLDEKKYTEEQGNNRFTLDDIQFATEDYVNEKQRMLKLQRQHHDLKSQIQKLQQEIDMLKAKNEEVVTNYNDHMHEYYIDELCFRIMDYLQNDDKFQNSIKINNLVYYPKTEKERDVIRFQYLKPSIKSILMNTGKFTNKDGSINVRRIHDVMKSMFKQYNNDWNYDQTNAYQLKEKIINEKEGVDKLNVNNY
jgi:cell division protein FtsB